MSTDALPPRCACAYTDAYTCWAYRYGTSAWDIEEIDHQGGPCDCPCHDGDGDEH